MIARIEISPLEKWGDPRGRSLLKNIQTHLKLKAEKVLTRDVYTICANLTSKEIKKVAEEFTNPVLQNSVVGDSGSHGCNWLICIGFLPGVTDNVGRTARDAIGDIIGRKLQDDEFVFSSVEYLIYSNSLTRNDVANISSKLLANPLIESTLILSAKELSKNGIPHNTPFVKESAGGEVREINLEVSDEELLRISSEGILSLSLDEMKTIQKYFLNLKGREKLGLKNMPTDVELEALAQTWSEHCKHKIFDAEIEYEDERGKKKKIVSCFKTFIKESTKKIASKKPGWLVSVFHDNAGVIAFNDKHHLVYKVETHNSPSALDPYGGAITGIVGVNRDPLGTGQGADLLINVWGYCLGSPFTNEKDVPPGLLHPRRLRDGIHKGVIDGGNQSGIPYGIGWEYFDPRYIGKPLVYCGTVGKLPVKIGKIKGHEKKILPGDLIVMGGGRIGKDGIHGATFSSEELRQESPTQAVQIGDPITQKKLSDFIKEARDLNLYRFITDNGAGGLSSSIGEMAMQCRGCILDLAKAPLKYAGLNPWEILLSEAQERMSFAVPPAKIKKFMALAKKRDVEVSLLGKFTNTGKFHITYGKKTVAYLDLDFMHNGLPRMKLKAKWTPPKHSEPEFKKRDLENDILAVLSSLNVCSNEYKARQYDHEVKGISVIKPFVGKCRDVQSDAVVFMSEPLSSEGVILSHAILPRYSDIDTYHMMASTIDLAIRRTLAVGGKPDRIAGLDNFCWPDPVQSAKTPDGEYKLAQLVRANQALYDYTIAFGVPCISGKDSMKNDSTKGGKKISIPPSVLFSTISKMDDISKAVTLDLKKPGDIICVVGLTKAELGGSEYFNILGATGNCVPKVSANLAKKIFSAIAKATDARLLHSVHAPALGGLAIGLAKIAIAGRLGANIDITKIPSEPGLSPHEILFSESNSRFIFSLAPENFPKVEKIFNRLPFAKIGVVSVEQYLRIKLNNNACISLPLDKLIEKYKSPLDNI